MQLLMPLQWVLLILQPSCSIRAARCFWVHYTAIGRRRRHCEWLIRSSRKSCVRLDCNLNNFQRVATEFWSRNLSAESLSWTTCSTPSENSSSNGGVAGEDPCNSQLWRLSRRPNILKAPGCRSRWSCHHFECQWETL